MREGHPSPRAQAAVPRGPGFTQRPRFHGSAFRFGFPQSRGDGGRLAVALPSWREAPLPALLLLMGWRCARQLHPGPTGNPGLGGDDTNTDPHEGRFPRERPGDCVVRAGAELL